MIVRKTIDGAKATVIYLTNDFSPTTEDKAQLVKIIYDNGKRVFGIPQGATKESQSFDSRMGRFLREAKKKKKIYYSRPMNRYKTATEGKNLEAVQERFPKAKIKYPRTKKHDELGMEYFHDQIDEADRVVLKPDRGTRLTTGVYSEARHAIKNRIPVYALYKGRMRKVRSVKTLKHPNKEGHFGRIIFRKKKRRK